MQLKIHTDGGSRGNPGISGGGIVVFDEAGKELHSASFSFGIKTNNEAEYLAVIRALEWLTEFSKKQNLKSVHFFLDSKLVVEQLSRHWKIREERLKDLAEQSWKLLSSLPYQVQFFHVERSRNEHADILANQAMDTAE